MNYFYNLIKKLKDEHHADESVSALAAILAGQQSSRRRGKTVKTLGSACPGPRRLPSGVDPERDSTIGDQE